MWSVVLITTANNYYALPQNWLISPKIALWPDVDTTEVEKMAERRSQPEADNWIKIDIEVKQRNFGKLQFQSLKRHVVEFNFYMRTINVIDVCLNQY